MEEFGKQGYSITEVRAHFDINYNLWSKWYRGWPDFRDIVERFQTLAEAFWLKFGKDNLGNKFFNSGLYSTCMFMRFKHARHIEKYLEDTGNKEDTEALGRAEDARLDDLFSGGTGNIEPPKRSPEPVRKAEDAEWMEVDLRTRPK